jgi:Ser/Thr protein kinase RdoA (MazF antagonist)
MEFDREWIVPLEREDARILVRHGGRPMTRYAAMLQLLRDGRWRTIRLIDNAHDAHHMHRYAGDLKRDAVSFGTGDPRDVLPKAVAYLVRASESIIASWQP